MQCLVCTGEARDLTPENFDGYVIGCPSAAITKSLEARGKNSERFSGGTQRGAGKSFVAQRRRSMANDQKYLLVTPLSRDAEKATLVDISKALGTSA